MIKLRVDEIHARNVLEIMEYSSMIRYQIFCHTITSLLSVAIEGCFPLTGTPHSECNVAPLMLHAAIPVYAPFSNRMCAPSFSKASVTIWITFDFPVPPSPVSCMRSHDGF